MRVLFTNASSFTGYSFVRESDEDAARERDRPCARAALYPRRHPCQHLAKAYTASFGATPVPATVRRLNPSRYPESQGAFADRARQEVAARLAPPCRLEFGTQTEFPEPPVRINSDLVNATALGWDEAWVWDEFVAYYTS